MTRKPTPALEPAPLPNAGPWGRAVCLALLKQLWTLRETLQASERRLTKTIQQIGVHQQNSARNLVHYLAFRATDLRALQDKLAWLGVSSLGRAESHVMANLDKVVGILHRLTGQPWQDLSLDEPAGSVTGARLLQNHADSLLGPAVASRSVRIMVTLGTEAATDFDMVRGLVKAGMDVARINCAHDNATAWRSMAKLVRRAAKAAQRDIKILMDLGGPKVRTGPMAPGPRVIKLRPRRDALGGVVQPSRLWISRSGETIASTACNAAIKVDASWLTHLHVGSSIDLTDARGKKRQLRVVECHPEGAVGECQKTYYLTPDVALVCKGSHDHKTFKTHPGGIDALPGRLRLLMLAAMAAPSAGVMIARGDLAVECGFERMAEIQEEILCCAEAAHMPVIWATQVLETLGKTGIPSRAEISDASMGERAECVMLNKGPYVTESIRALDDILKRMAGHQAKKNPLLRALRAWSAVEVV